jgi:adenylate cyclase class 2
MKGRKSGQVENEIKLEVANIGVARRLLRAAGFRVSRPRVFESNIVLDTPNQAILRSGSLLRLRRVGKLGLLTFKGPPDNYGPHKSRLEVESEIAQPDAVRFLLGNLGYHPVFLYEKYRTEFARPHESGMATLDETPMGVYMELEGSPRWVDRSARRLGFSPTDYITSSYGRLWAEYCAARGEARGDMLFSPRRA